VPRPHLFFPEEVRGLLRAAWATKSGDWYDLPGPPEWWPDDPAYYDSYGFEVMPKKKDGYLKALLLLGKCETAPKGWYQAVVGDGMAQNELFWDGKSA
jgi:hypothetical protein